MQRLAVRYKLSRSCHRHSLLLFKKAETYKKLEPMPVEDAGEREEKQRDEPSRLSSLWEDAGITQENSFARSLQMWYARGRENRGAGPIWQCPSPQAGVHPRSGHTRQVSV
jgi:hypothetical protein